MSSEGECNALGSAATRPGAKARTEDSVPIRAAKHSAIVPVSVGNEQLALRMPGRRIRLGWRDGGLQDI